MTPAELREPQVVPSGWRARQGVSEGPGCGGPGLGVRGCSTDLALGRPACGPPVGPSGLFSPGIVLCLVSKSHTPL